MQWIAQAALVRGALKFVDDTRRRRFLRRTVEPNDGDGIPPTAPEGFALRVIARRRHTPRRVVLRIVHQEKHVVPGIPLADDGPCSAVERNFEALVIDVVWLRSDVDHQTGIRERSRIADHSNFHRGDVRFGMRERQASRRDGAQAERETQVHPPPHECSHTRGSPRSPGSSAAATRDPPCRSESRDVREPPRAEAAPSVERLPQPPWLQGGTTLFARAYAMSWPRCS